METGEINVGRGGRGPRAPRPPAPPERPKPPSPPPSASAAEQMTILKMVEDGRITPEEADTLLKALGA
jgi:membrane peptidoglycan carboxypeptidase